MPAILIIAHAPLASSLRAVAQHVYPDCSRNLAALDVDEGASPEGVEMQARDVLRGLGGGDALVLADVYGATPANIGRRLCHAERVSGVAGVNLPMLLRVVCSPNKPLQEMADLAVEGGRECIVHMEH